MVYHRRAKLYEEGLVMSEIFVFWRTFLLQIILFFFVLPFVCLGIIHGLDGLVGLAPMLDKSWSVYLFGFSFAVGSIFMFWSNYYIFVHGRGTPLEIAGQAVKQTIYLIRTGPYAFVRNPMAFGFGMMYVAGIGFLLNSWLTVPLLFLFFYSLVIYLRTWEEKGLEKRFGSAYVKYKGQVHAVIPRLIPLRVDASEVIKVQLPPVIPLGLVVVSVMWAGLAYCLYLDWEIVFKIMVIKFSVSAWMPFLLYSTWYGLNIGLTVLALGGMPEFSAKKTEMMV